MDFRELNKLVIADRYPLPLISDIFDALKGAKYFTSLDLLSAYHRFPVLAEHQHKTAFTWNDVQYKFLRAPFGLKNLPSQFQRVIHYVFQDCSFVRTFIDDAIVFSSDWDSHVQHVKEAIKRLNDAMLILNIEKCHFFKTSLRLLGFRIDTYDHSIDPDQAEKTVEWPIPRTGKQIQAYLGFVNYFREHIPTIHKLTAPLDRLRNTKRICTSEWAPECQNSFDKLKDILFAAPPLAFPDSNIPFLVATDASNTGIGAVLYQEHPETKEIRYISFQARSLTQSESNYSATKRELLAIVFALRKFHRFLWGFHFTLYTDHRALTYIHTQRNLSPMLVGLYDLIYDYDFAVFHRPGIQNILPDALSRFFPDIELDPAPAKSTVAVRSTNITNSAPIMRFTKLRPEAIAPTKAHPTDVGFDLHSYEDTFVPANHITQISTKIAVCPPPGYYIQLHDRSSVGALKLRVVGGVIDPANNGGIMVILNNHCDFDTPINKGDKIA